MGQAPHHAQVLPAGEVLVDCGVLTGQPDESAHDVGLLHHVVAQNGGPAGVGMQDGREDAHGRRLAGPVGPQEPEDSALRHFEGGAVEGAHVAPREDLDQVYGLNGLDGGVVH